MADKADIKTRIDSVLEDPSTKFIANVYATALLDAAAEKNVSSQDVLEEFESFLEDVLAQQPTFRSLLVEGILNRDKVLGLIDRCVGPFASELFTNFLRILARHDRVSLVVQICQQVRELHEDRTGAKRVQVKSAADLSNEAVEKIRQQLDGKFGFHSILEVEVDPAILGGLVIQIGDTVYDSSLRTRLNQLRGRLRERSLHEVQSRRDRFSHPEGD